MRALLSLLVVVVVACGSACVDSSSEDAEASVVRDFFAAVENQDREAFVEAFDPKLRPLGDEADPLSTIWRDMLSGVPEVDFDGIELESMEMSSGAAVVEVVRGRVRVANGDWSDMSGTSFFLDYVDGRWVIRAIS